MSYSLPKATQTRKLQSLSGDLRSIAEELIAKKFDIPEVMERTAPSPFEDYATDPGTRQVRYEDSYVRTGYAAAFSSTNVDDRYRGSGIDVEYDVRTRQRMARSQVFESTPTGIMEASRKLDYANIPREGRSLKLCREHYGRMMQNPDIIFYDNSNGASQLYGMQLKLDDRAHATYIEVIF